MRASTDLVSGGNRREVEQSNMVMKQQLYRAQALLRNKALLTIHGVQQHAADINNVLAFPEEPLWAMGNELSGNGALSQLPSSRLCTPLSGSAR